MTGKTHQVGGLCAGIIATTILFNKPTISGLVMVGVPLVLMSILGSLLPDIDHTGSTVGKRLKFLSYPISRIFGHRGFIHSPLFCLLLGIVLQLFYSKVPEGFQPIYYGASLGITVGYASHLFLDALTVSGVPLLSPISNKKYKLMRLKTGKHEWFAIIILTIITTACVCFNWF